MNLLEQHVKAVHSEKPYTEPWTRRFDNEFVKVELTSECYGQESRHEEVWTKEQWEEIKKQGYYMG